MNLSKLLLSLFCATTAFATLPEPSLRDVAYGKHSRNTLDIWFAPGDGPRPLLIYIHGGAWMSNDKNQVRSRVPITEWLEKGVSVASINYRYSTEAPLPAPVHDAARAVQFLRYKAGEFNLDPARIVLQGGSAGGCSSLWIAFHDDLADLSSADPVSRQSTRVLGAYAGSAQTSIDPVLLKAWIGEKASSHGMIFRGVGAASSLELLRNYDQYKALLEEFSPITHLDADDPPVYLTYPADLSLPPTSMASAIHHGMFGLELKKAADAIGHRCVLSIPGAEDPGQSAVEFLESVLNKDNQ